MLVDYCGSFRVVFARVSIMYKREKGESCDMPYDYINITGTNENKKFSVISVRSALMSALFHHREVCVWSGVGGFLGYSGV